MAHEPFNEIRRDYFLSIFLREYIWVKEVIFVQK